MKNYFGREQEIDYYLINQIKFNKIEKIGKYKITKYKDSIIK
jgi:hypothetical protein